MCRLVGVGVAQVNWAKWSNIQRQLERLYKGRYQDSPKSARERVLVTLFAVKFYCSEFLTERGTISKCRAAFFGKDRNLAPFMIHELLPRLTETASGSHPCCVVSVTYHRPSYFHGGKTGSNLVSDAKSNQQLTFNLASLLHVTVCNVKTGAANFLPSAWIWGTIIKRTFHCPCRFRAVSAALHGISRVRSHLPQANYIKLR